MARSPRTPRTPRSASPPKAAPTAAPKAARTTRTPRTVVQPAPRRSHAGRIMAAALGVASAAGVGVGLNNNTPPAAPPAASARIIPDASVTPGVTDPAVSGPEICSHDWKQGPPGMPPTHGGTLTYSQAARHTSEAVKEQSFANYGIADPRDGGVSYEVDHRIPLALGGRDVIGNLWPQSRTATGFNAWVKDRLENRLYNLMCHPKPGDPPVTLPEIQTALRGDWTKAYDTYCTDETECPVGAAGAE